MLSADTSRVDGPLHAIYCLEGDLLVAGEELCVQNLSEQGGFSGNDAEWPVQKKSWEILRFEFYRTASDKHKCRKRECMVSVNHQPLTSSPYALHDSHLRI